jgi:hypothetical protein
MTSFLDNRKVRWGAGGAAGECRCVAAQRSLHEVASGLNIFSHSNMYLDDGSSSLPSICKTIPSDRRSIPSTSKRPHNVQITAEANCDRRQRIGNRERRASAATVGVARARGLRTLLVCLLGGMGTWSQALEASRSAAATGITRAIANKPRHACLSVPAMRVAGEDVQERGQVAAAVDFA